MHSIPVHSRCAPKCTGMEPTSVPFHTAREWLKSNLEGLFLRFDCTTVVLLPRRTCTEGGSARVDMSCSSQGYTSIPYSRVVDAATACRIEADNDDGLGTARSQSTKHTQNTMIVQQTAMLTEIMLLEMMVIPSRT